MFFLIFQFGITPLFWAVYNNYKNVAHYLLNMGAKHNRVTKVSRICIIFFVCHDILGGDKPPESVIN